MGARGQLRPFGGPGVPSKRTRYAPLLIPESFGVGLARRPADWALRSVIADWLEDNGDVLGAECVRWQVQNRKRPDRSSFYEPEGKWAWWALFPPRPWDTDRPCGRDVPEPLWNKLPPKTNEFSGARAYATQADAEHALRVAWGRLTPRQRTAVWAWPKPAGRKKPDR